LVGELLEQLGFKNCPPPGGSALVGNQQTPQVALGKNGHHQLGLHLKLPQKIDQAGGDLPILGHIY
jgi:hypothetical protein